MISSIYFIPGMRRSCIHFLPFSYIIDYLEKVELIEGGTFWLSESPSVPGSISWGTTVPCIATWAISFWFLLSCCSFFFLRGVNIKQFFY